MIDKARLPQVQIKSDRKFTEIKLDKLAGIEANRHIGKGKGIKFVHNMRRKYKDKNDTKCNNYTPYMYDRPI